MRMISFEEREDLVRRSGGDVLDFILELRWRGRKTRMKHKELMSRLLHSPKQTDLGVLGIRQKLAELGAELTPQEAELKIAQLMLKVRETLRDVGIPEDDISEQDSELIKFLSKN